MKARLEQILTELIGILSTEGLNSSDPLLQGNLTSIIDKLYTVSFTVTDGRTGYLARNLGKVIDVHGSQQFASTKQLQGLVGHEVYHLVAPPQDPLRYLFGDFLEEYGVGPSNYFASYKQEVENRANAFARLVFGLSARDEIGNGLAYWESLGY